MKNFSQIVLVFGITCLSFSFSASAAVFSNLDTTNLLACTFSSKHHNRVMIDNGRIEKIIGADERQLSIHMEDLSGQAFIRCLDPNLDEISLSVVSQTGMVQDLQIFFSERPCEVVVLHDVQQEKEKNEDLEYQSINSEIPTVSIVSEILIGSIPEGYIPCSISPQKCSPKSGIMMERIAELEGACDVLYVYRISNTTKRKLNLLECELQNPESRWIFLETNTLMPKQKIFGIISVEKYAQ